MHDVVASRGPKCFMVSETASPTVINNLAVAGQAARQAARQAGRQASVPMAAAAVIIRVRRLQALDCSPLWAPPVRNH